MTLYNDVVRRPHLPRGAAIRNLMANTGVNLCLYGPSSSDDLQEEHVEEELAEEGGESEVESVEDDPCSYDKHIYNFCIRWCLFWYLIPPKRTRLTDHCFWPIAVLIPEAVKMSVARSVVLRKPRKLAHQRLMMPLVMPLIRIWIFIHMTEVKIIYPLWSYSMCFGSLDLSPAALFNPRLLQKYHRQQIQPALNLEAWMGPSSHLRHEVTPGKVNKWFCRGIFICVRDGVFLMFK